MSRCKHMDSYKLHACTCLQHVLWLAVCSICRHGHMLYPCLQQTINRVVNKSIHIPYTSSKQCVVLKTGLFRSNHVKTCDKLHHHGRSLLCPSFLYRRLSKLHESVYTWCTAQLQRPDMNLSEANEYYFVAAKEKNYRVSEIGILCSTEEVRIREACNIYDMFISTYIFINKTLSYKNCRPIRL